MIQLARNTGTSANERFKRYMHVNNAIVRVRALWEKLMAFAVLIERPEDLEKILSARRVRAKLFTKGYLIPIIWKVTLDTSGTPSAELAMRRRNGRIVTVREHIVNLPDDITDARRHFVALLYDALVTPAIQEEIQFANDYVRQLKLTNPNEYEVGIGLGIDCRVEFDMLSESVVVCLINTEEGDVVEDVLTLDEFIRLFPMYRRL